MLLNWLSLIAFVGSHAISIFNTVLMLWLGLTVLLTGDRRKPATIVGSAGLLLGAVFFGGHTLIISNTLVFDSAGVNVVWPIMWVIAVAAPFFWGLSIFYYSGNPTTGRWVRGILSTAAFILTLIMFAFNPLPSYTEFLISPGLNPTIAWAYVPYLILCFTLPLIALREPRTRSVDLSSQDTRPYYIATRHERYRGARPWLIVSASMLALAVVAFTYTAYSIVPRLIPIQNATRGVIGEIFLADLLISGFIGMAVVLLGRAVLSNNVLTEQVQSTQGFFARWRNVVLVLALGSILITLLYLAPIRPIYSLLLTTVLAVSAYALFIWRERVEHQGFMDRLRPFVSSLHLHDQLLSAGEQRGWDDARNLFNALCRDALRTKRACLLFDNPVTLNVLTSIVPDTPRRLDYQWSSDYEVMLQKPMRVYGGWTRLDADHWAWPLSDSRGQVGRLVLGPRFDSTEYTSQELDVAAACAERILDALAGDQIARVALSLLRQRISEVQVMSMRHKRLLHDELLPQIHLALLRLEALRKQPVEGERRLDEAAAALTHTHQLISTLVREMSNALPNKLESEGLVAALHGVLNHDFNDGFEEIYWRTSPEAIDLCRRLPVFVGEVIFYAAQEVIRNAARYGRGDDPSRKLHLDIAIECGSGLRLTIGDDGVGRAHALNGKSEFDGSRPAGAHSGLRFHSTMMAVVGGSLSVLDRSSGGTQVVIELPQV